MRGPAIPTAAATPCVTALLFYRTHLLLYRHAFLQHTLKVLGDHFYGLLAVVCQIFHLEQAVKLFFHLACILLRVHRPLDQVVDVALATVHLALHFLEQGLQLCALIVNLSKLNSIVYEWSHWRHDARRYTRLLQPGALQDTVLRKRYQLFQLSLLLFEYYVLEVLALIELFPLRILFLGQRSQGEPKLANVRVYFLATRNFRSDLLRCSKICPLIQTGNQKSWRSLLRLFIQLHLCRR